MKEKEAADAILRRLNGRIKRADNESEVISFNQLRGIEFQIATLSYQ